MSVSEVDYEEKRESDVLSEAGTYIVGLFFYNI